MVRRRRSGSVQACRTWHAIGFHDGASAASRSHPKPLLAREAGCIDHRPDQPTAAGCSPDGHSPWQDGHSQRKRMSWRAEVARHESPHEPRELRAVEQAPTAMHTRRTNGIGGSAPHFRIANKRAARGRGECLPFHDQRIAYSGARSCGTWSACRNHGKPSSARQEPERNSRGYPCKQLIQLGVRCFQRAASKPLNAVLPISRDGLLPAINGLPFDAKPLRRSRCATEVSFDLVEGHAKYCHDLSTICQYPVTKKI